MLKFLLIVLILIQLSLTSKADDIKDFEIEGFYIGDSLLETYSEEAIETQRPAMIDHLDEVRGFMEELSPELGVTDPVSGNIVSKVGFHDR